MMIKIPKYDGQQVTTDVVQGARARNQDVSSANTQLINSVTNVAIESLQRADDMAAEEALLKFENEKNQVFFAPETGYFNTSGRIAFDKAPEVNERLEEMKRRYSDDLKSPRAKQSFEKVVNRHITTSQQDIMRHASKNLDAWEMSIIKSQVNSTIENATLYWNDDERVKQQLALGENDVQKASFRRGDAPEVTADELNTYRSSFASSVITSALRNGSAVGKQYIDKYSSLLRGTDYAKVQTALKKVEAAEKIKIDANYAIGFAGKAVDAVGDQPDARSKILEEVNTIEDPELRRKVMRESMYQLEMKQKALSEERAAVYDSASKFIANPDAGGIEKFKQDFPDQWENLTSEQQRQLSSGKPIINDYSTYLSLVSMSPDKLAKVNVSDYIHKLDESHRNKLLNAVNKAKSGLVDGQSTRDQQRAQRIQDLLGFKTPKGETQVRKYNSLNRVMDSMIESRMQQTGQTFLSDDDYKKVLADFSRTVIKERDYWLDTKQDLTNIEQENLDAYTDYLRKNNIPVSTKNLLILDGDKSNREAALKGFNQ
jgi:hypothetical protein